MKTILIETVSNGWIVRPFTPTSDWCCTDPPVIAVYTSIEDIRNDLPVLLDSPFKKAQEIPSPTI